MEIFAIICMRLIVLVVQLLNWVLRIIWKDGEGDLTASFFIVLIYAAITGVCGWYFLKWSAQLL